MKRDQIQKQSQNAQAEKKDQAVIRVSSALRAGVSTLLYIDPCC